MSRTDAQRTGEQRRESWLLQFEWSARQGNRFCPACTMRLTQYRDNYGHTDDCLLHKWATRVRNASGEPP